MPAACQERLAPVDRSGVGDQTPDKREKLTGEQMAWKELEEHASFRFNAIGRPPLPDVGFPTTPKRSRRHQPSLLLPFGRL